MDSNLGRGLLDRRMSDVLYIVASMRAYETQKNEIKKRIRSIISTTCLCVAIILFISRHPIDPSITFVRDVQIVLPTL